MSEGRQTRPQGSGYRPPRGASGLSALTEGFLIAWEAMRANLIRSVLTVLGVAVGLIVLFIGLRQVVTGQVLGSLSEAADQLGTFFTPDA